ncbi:MAG: zeta toxin family protein [Flavobacteriales bacterium]
MLGDIITIKDEFFQTSKSIVQQLSKRNFWNNKFVIAIAGESGSGKSVTATCLQQELLFENKKALVLHLDDYFKLPPKTNHEAREKDISRVGVQEIRLGLVQLHINEFLENKSEILKPIVHYKENKILAEQVDIEKYDCIIVEGTYSFFLENLNFKIFLDSTFQESKKRRDARGREKSSLFIESVLKIEQAIIRSRRIQSNLIFDHNYNLILTQ